MPHFHFLFPLVLLVLVLVGQVVEAGVFSSKSKRVTVYIPLTPNGPQKLESNEFATFCIRFNDPRLFRRAYPKVHIRFKRTGILGLLMPNQAVQITTMETKALGQDLSLTQETLKQNVATYKMGEEALAVDEQRDSEDPLKFDHFDISKIRENMETALTSYQSIDCARHFDTDYIRQASLNTKSFIFVRLRLPATGSDSPATYKLILRHPRGYQRFFSLYRKLAVVKYAQDENGQLTIPFTITQRGYVKPESMVTRFVVNPCRKAKEAVGQMKERWIEQCDRLRGRIMKKKVVEKEEAPLLRN